MPTVNGTPTAADANGITQGSFTTASSIAGGSGNDKLQSNHGNDVMYGSTGNDTFIVKAGALANASGTTSGIAADDVIYDFGGAGGWTATNNDFLALSGFGAGSTFTFDHFGGQAGVAGNPADTHLQYYTVHDTTTGNDYTLFIKSVNGNQLGKADYAFY